MLPAREALEQLGDFPWPRAVVAVVDQIRATSTIVAALAAGAREVWPVDEPSEALGWREADPSWLLAGERGAVRLPGFDFGNSPREIEAAAFRLRGGRLALATTNGSRALAAVPASAAAVYAFALMNVSATAHAMARAAMDAGAERMLIVCAGTEGSLAVDDLLAAGTLVDRLAGWGAQPSGDAALVALAVHRLWRGGELECLRASRAGRNVMAVGLGEDLAACADVDRCAFAARRHGRAIVREDDASNERKG